MAKKTQKIETPIDKRETFVSIQKSFADSDVSVGEKLKTLYALQQVDTEIDKILQLRGELPLEVENLEAEISDLKAKVANISAQIEEANAKMAEVTSLDNKFEEEAKAQANLNAMQNSASSAGIQKAAVGGVSGAVVGSMGDAAKDDDMFDSAEYKRALSFSP